MARVDTFHYEATLSHCFLHGQEKKNYNFEDMKKA